MILRVNLNMTSQPSAPQTLDAESVTRGLLARGFDELDLVGLSLLRAKLRDGSACETMPLRTDDDATFLIESANFIFRMTSAPRPVTHRTYLWDGSFEITGLILEDRVRVRAGEYQSHFDPESDEGVALSFADYRAMWANIARTLLDGAQGAQGAQGRMQ